MEIDIFNKKEQIYSDIIERVMNMTREDFFYFKENKYMYLYNEK
jgi:hypothetical protein